MEEQYAMAFDTILEELKNRGNNKSEQGTIFEDFCKMILEKSPLFSDDIAKVWKWKEFPGNGGMHDNGIDLVAIDKQGNYWAIQCKFFNRDSSVSKGDIDSFISATCRSFSIEGKEYTYTQKYVFSTTENVSLNSSNLFTLIGPSTLIECGIDWKQFSLDKIDDVKIEPQKKPKPHQENAINDVIKGFETNSRGKLIMACGTGKTFTSLMIVEELYKKRKDKDKSFNVLYLVPSIALLSQTIIEWKTQLSYTGWSVRPFGICSDQTAGQEKKNKKDQDEILINMPIPATTDVLKVTKEYKSKKCDINIFFSTYQSIDVISKVSKNCSIDFDIAVCDEAHRTIGTYQTGNEEDKSNFLKIHDDKCVPCKKRLYMTATEKIYSLGAKQSAAKEGYTPYSMDDENIYGPEFHRLSFGDAVSKQLLADYKIVVLTVNKNDIARLNLPIKNFKTLDDSAKIIGAVTALSKIPSEINKDEFISDPKPMKRAVAFCQTIAQAKAFSESFNSLKDNSCLGIDTMKKENLVIPIANFITGQDKTSDRNKRLNWLREDIKDGECHILTNARCLSEGVDVPSLDSIIFMARKKSQVDIIQAVGRVMRKFGSGSEKKYGYIIIPVVIDNDKLTDAELSSNEDYKVVWQVVQALRSHDERLNIELNKLPQTGKLPNNLCYIETFIPRQLCNKRAMSSSAKTERNEGLDDDNPFDETNTYSNFKHLLPTKEELKENENIFSAKLVKNCGNRLYWDNWSNDIGNVTTNLFLKIKNQIEGDESNKKSFDKFVKNFRSLINPNISEDLCMEMLSEHIVTLPVLKAIFNENDLIELNPISKIMEKMVKKLKGIESEIKELQPFYESVKLTVSEISTKEGRQEVIRTLFEKFFKYAMPDKAEKFGIVFTPVEVVDFMINSVSDVLENEFNESLINKGIKILDPFTGTGTYVVRLLDKLKELGISDEDFKYKYKNDIWCNEIMLLSYYISLINIEDTYGRIIGEFEPFTHDVLTDTFETAEKHDKQNILFEEDDFQTANKKVEDEKKENIRIIISNPPYSVGQKDAMDNNANTKYETIDNRIQETYVKDVHTQLIRGLYDSYIRAFRWASDRIGDNGILSFVSNGNYINNLSFSGFRRELLKEFNHIYVFNLRGDCRTSGEIRRKEKDNIFGEGSRTPISIIVLVKHKDKPFDGFIHYKDIGDYLTKKEKLEIINKSESISKIDWETIYPDKYNDWINKKNDNFENFKSIGNKSTVDVEPSIFSCFYSRGIATGKDAWLYNFDKNLLETNIRNYIDFYEKESNRVLPLLKGMSKEEKEKKIKDLLNLDKTMIKWDDDLLCKMANGKHINNSSKSIRESLYRPFVKTNFCYCLDLIQRIYRYSNIMPTNNCKNTTIVIPGMGNKKDFSCIATDTLIDLGCMSAAQSFPLKWYEKESIQPSFFKSESNEDGYICNDSINDEELLSFQRKYNDTEISKEKIFTYIYGLFHMPKYKELYANNLSKELPRIPFLSNFDLISSIGKELMNLHINYENAKPYDKCTIKTKKEDYSIRKITFLNSAKRTILFNENITIDNIPSEIYEYKVNGRSPIEWIMDQYQYSIDKDSRIINDPNKFKPEGGKYVFDLILSLITVSLETQKLIKELPEYKEI